VDGRLNERRALLFGQGSLSLCESGAVTMNFYIARLLNHSGLWLDEKQSECVP